MTSPKLRDALRQWGRHPLVSIGIIAIIAVGVATTTALFAVVDGLLLRPLPYREGHRLVSLRWPAAPALRRLTAPERERLRDSVETTPLLCERAVAGFGALFDAQGEPALVNTAVSSNLFEVLGVRPLAGRGLTADDLDKDPPVVIIGHSLWRTQFGGDREVLGRRTTLGGRNVVVVGVMPPDFDYPAGTNVWSSLGRFQAQSIPTVARLARGATAAQLQRALAPVEVRPLRETVRPKGALTLLLLLGGSGFLLLIAWTQVAALQLARFPDRLREVGVRVALGASHRHLVGQFAVEGLVLCLPALAIAWLLSSWFSAIAAAVLPAEMMRGQHVVADMRVFLFACALTAMGVLVCAVAPAATLLRHQAADSLRGEMFAGQSRAAGSRIRRALLMGQLAVTALLLYVAGLATHAFIAVDRVDLGFEPRGLLVVSMRATAMNDNPEAAVATRELQTVAMLGNLRRVRGVTGVAAATTYPLRQGGFVAGLSVPASPAWEPMSVRINRVTPEYFRVVRLPVLAGRIPADASPTQHAVVNETLGRALSSEGPVIGQEIAVGGFRAQIAAVIRDCVSDRPDGLMEPQVYLLSTSGVSLALVRASDDAATMAALQAVVDRTSYPAKGRRIRRVDDDRRRANADYRARMLLLGVLATVGLSIAILGVGGGLYHEVTQQTRAIAIRTTLGAQPGDIVWRIIRRALGWASCAGLVGSAAGAAAGQAARSLLFNVSGFDGLTILAVCGLLGALALTASYPAVRQALSVDPASVLRHE